MTTTRWLCLLFAILATMPDQAVAQLTKLRLTLQVPITNHLGANLMQFKDEVERRTNNAISIEIFDKGQLYIDERVVDPISISPAETASLDSISSLTGPPPSTSSRCRFFSISKRWCAPPRARAASSED